MEGAFLTTTASHRRCIWPQHKLNDRRNVNSNTARFSDSVATKPQAAAARRIPIGARTREFTVRKRAQDTTRLPPQQCFAGVLRLACAHFGRRCPAFLSS